MAVGLQYSPRGAPRITAESYAAGFRARAVLRDGTPVCVRALQPDDRERLRLAFERLSPESVYRRFFRRAKELTAADLRYFAEPDFRDHVGLVLTVVDDGDERLIAVGHFVRVISNDDRAELALTVADEYQHRGAATLLLQQLVGVARGLGVREFVAVLLEDNREGLEILENSKLPFRKKLEHGVLRVLLSLDADSAV